LAAKTSLAWLHVIIINFVCMVCYPSALESRTFEYTSRWSEHYQVTQPIKYCSCYAIASWNGLSDSSPQVHLFPTCRKHPALFRLASHLTQLPSSTRVYIPLLTLLQCFHHCGQVTYRHFPFPDNSCWTISSADSCVLSY